MTMLKRKREGKTDYRQRLNLLKSGKTRLIVRKTNKNVIVQFVEFNEDGDKVLLTVNSGVLNKFGWGGAKRNLPCAYLTGLYAGKKAKEKGVSDAILDAGLSVSIKRGVIYSALKGVLDGGINVPHSKEVLPDEKRIMGEHIKEYFNKLKEKKSNIFSDYLKHDFNPDDIPKKFNEIKKKILENEGKL